MFGFEKKQTVVKIQVRSREGASAAYAMQHSGGYWKDDGTWFSPAGEKAVQFQRTSNPKP